MSFPVSLVSSAPNVRVVPVRFARAATGVGSAASPDIDDRGFVPTAGGQAHGATLGLTAGQAARIKIVRDWVSNDAPLFVSVADPSIVAIRRPAAGTPLDPVLVTRRVGVPMGGGEVRTIDEPVDGDWQRADTVELDAQASHDEVRETTLRVHFGDGGPVLGELFVRVYAELTVHIKIHMVRIARHHHSDFVGPTTTAAAVRENLERAAQIFKQAGLAFQIHADVDSHEIHLSRAGEVHEPESGTTESPQVFRLAPLQGHLNVYAIHQFRHGDGLDGLGTNRGWGAQAGLIVTDYQGEWYGTQVTAHEMGHAFGLEHYARGNGSDHVRSDQREDLWARRNLMWNGHSAHPERNFYRATEARRYNGYPGEGGALYCKRLSQVSQSDQVHVIRDTISRNLHTPAPPRRPASHP